MIKYANTVSVKRLIDLHVTELPKDPDPARIVTSKYGGRDRNRALIVKNNEHNLTTFVTVILPYLVTAQPKCTRNACRIHSILQVVVIAAPLGDGRKFVSLQAYS